jgi:hypothetical protein
MEPRQEVKREPKSAEAPKAEPKRKRFRIVKLEERIAPLASSGPCESVPSRRGCTR